MSWHEAQRVLRLPDALLAAQGAQLALQGRRPGGGGRWLAFAAASAAELRAVGGGLAALAAARTAAGSLGELPDELAARGHAQVM